MDEWAAEHGGLFLWSVIFGVIGAVPAGYAFYRLTLRPKKVDWLPISASPILAIEEEQRQGLKELKVVWGGDQEIENPNLVLVRVANTGAYPVTQQDFDPGVSFDFGQDTLLRPAVIRQAHPAATISVVDVTDHTCKVEVSSLSKGEWFDVQFITDSDKAAYPDVGGRVIGRRKISKLGFKDKQMRVAGWVTAATLVAAVPILLLVGLFEPTLDNGHVTPDAAKLNAVIAWVLFAVFVAASLVYFWSNYQNARIRRLLRRG